MKYIVFFALLASLAISCSARHRLVRQAVEETDTSTPAETTSASTAQQNSAVEETTAAVEVEENKVEEEKDDAEMSAEIIKEENVEKCQKCLKPTFKFKHEAFCGKCAAQKIIDAEEAEELSDAIQCKKCLKAKYKARHEEFCSNECVDMEEEKEVEKKVEEKEEEIVTESVKMVDAEEDEEKEEEEVEASSTENQVNKKNKNKRKKNKNQNKKNANKFTTEMDEEKVEETTTMKIVELGPLGNLIKALVVQNTWVS
ncbi:cilia- and flagella-associated protein 251 [Eurytemora carolleeae]|uniref:cilia- and flagella-associated protein 251 n=1 Tax=Eurytemora carolleeae TaxID=1294199 RepID=UPI000C784D1A|nr:cilia- and flagella-associated protein 251 [Eurytemora carolleeae]|eukprot:XP_023338578.1 cilia- and flagella-associated protein 251-like [Eurytemora affinis]